MSNQGEYVVTNATVTLTDNVSHTTAEGGTVTYTLTDPSTPNGTTEHYTFTETGAALQVATGSGAITMNNGVGTLTVPTLANVINGPSGTLTLSVDGQTDNVTVTQATQTATPLYSTINEGATELFTVATSGAAASLQGITEPWGLTSTSSPSGLAQIAPANRSGSLTLDSNGAAVVNIPTFATVFNTTNNPTFTINIGPPGASSLLTSTVTINEDYLLVATDSVGGTPNQSIFGTSVVEQTSGGSMTDGQSVTFTVSIAGLNGATVYGAAVAGQTEAWSLSGTALGQVTSATSGTLTLDANGTATVTVDTLFSSTSPLTDGTGTLTFQLTT